MAEYIVDYSGIDERLVTEHAEECINVNERIVRCRDCEYCDSDSEYRSGDMFCQYHGSFQDGLDGFCSWGEWRSR